MLDVNKLNSNEPILVETEVGKNEGKHATSDIVTLRIRTETGKRNLIIKLLITDKMSSVYAATRPYLENKANAKTFELRTNFPNRPYLEGDAKTLKELGLAPSCALVVHTANK